MSDEMDARARAAVWLVLLAASWAIVGLIVLAGMFLWGMLR